MRKATVLGVLALAGTLGSPAFADEFSGFRMTMNMNSDMLEGDFAFQGLGTQSVNSRRFGYGLGGGWAFNRYFAFEAALHGGTEFNTEATSYYAGINVPPVAPDTTDDLPNFKIRNNIRSIDLTAVGSVWIGEKFSVFGRLGMMGWKGETSYQYGDPDSATITFDEIHDTGFAPMGGIGIQTVLDRALIRAEYDYVDAGDLPNGSYFGQFDNTITSLSFSVVWIFR